MKLKLVILAVFLVWRFATLGAQPVSAPALPRALPPDADYSTNWYRQCLRKIHFDMHTPGNVPDIGKYFDAGEFARQLKNAGFDAVSYFAKDGYGWSYYPTKIGMMNPGLQYDLFGRGVAALKKQHLRVIAYYGLAEAPVQVAEKHPEWRLISNLPMGQKRENGGYTFCLFTPYIEDYVLPQLEEIAGHYDIDGLFLDNLPGLTDTECDCPICHAARAAAGFATITAGNEEDYHRWQLQRVKQRCALIFDTLHRAYPRLAVGINYMSAERHGISFPPPENTGFLTADIVNPGDVYLCTDYELAGWTWRGVPADCMQMRMLTSWRDWTTRSLASRLHEAALALARGTTYFIGDILPPQSLALDPEIMSLHKQVNDFLGERSSLMGGHSIAEIAVLHDSVVCNREPDKEEYGLGAFAALMDDGETTHVLQAYDLADRLANYHVLVISHCPALADNAVGAIQDFVRNGGNLVLTGPVPARNAAALANLAGVAFSGNEISENTFLMVTNLPFSPALRDRMHALTPVVCDLPAAVATPAGAQTLCALTATAWPGNQGALLPGAVTEDVGISLNHYGSGRVLYCSMPLAQDYWQRGNIEAKYLLQVMTRYLAPALLVDVKSDAIVNVYTTRRNSELLVHLIARTPESRTAEPHTEESSPAIYGLELTLHLAAPPRSIQLVPGGESLAWQPEGDGYRVELPPLKTHACCVIQLASDQTIH
jgi:hypothetical protein